MADRKQQVEQTLNAESVWMKSQPGIVGYAIGIDDDDRDVIRVYIEPAYFDELSQVIKEKLGDLAFPVVSAPRAF